MAAIRNRPFRRMTLRQLIRAGWGHRHSNTLWQRMLKCCIACIIAFIISLVPHFDPDATFLIPMVVVFAHPGQRLGIVVESLLLIIVGTFIGIAWSLFGLYLASLIRDNPSASYTIRGLFLLVCLLIHGYARSAYPRNQNFSLFLLIAVILTVTLPSKATSRLWITNFVPVLLGSASSLVVNLCLFPELSSSFLGSSTTESLIEATDTLARATHWFMAPGVSPTNSRGNRPDLNRKHSSGFRKKPMASFMSQFPNPFKVSDTRPRFSSLPIHATKLGHLTEQKPRLRTHISRCKAAQDEVNFEISISPLAPNTLKPISTKFMVDLVRNIMIIIGACENKFLIVGPLPSNNDAPRSPEGLGLDEGAGACSEGTMAAKKIHTTDAQLLESIVTRVRDSVHRLQLSLAEASNAAASALAYCFDVPCLPSGAPTPSGVQLEEMDVHIDSFTQALALFDLQTAEQLKKAVLGRSDEPFDFTPRVETFLISSFLLAYRDSAVQVLQILRHARQLVEMRQRSRDRSRLWMPSLASLRQWLFSGEEAEPHKTRQAGKSGDNDNQTSNQSRTDGGLVQDEQNGRQRNMMSNKSRDSSWTRRARAKTADAMEWARRSDDVAYAIKLAVAVFLVTWPGLVASWNSWYIEIRGIWAPMQLILVFEVAIGTSIFVFALRLAGVVFGCVAGFVANEMARGNRIGVGAALLLGIIPSVYIQIGTKYVKAGMVSIVSMAVVAFAATSSASPAYDVFKRLVAFLIGALVAMLVEVVVTPVRARDCLVKCLSDSLHHIQRMQRAMYVGIDGSEIPDLQSRELLNRFDEARDRAQEALNGAATVLPDCLNEPRLKGSFKPLAPIYLEIIYVLQQIVDRMDGVVQLRGAYGSSVLEELYTEVFAYRRNVAASSALILFSVSGALMTRLPLPQFIPSARIAQLRLINHVRELVIAEHMGKGAGHHQQQQHPSTLDEHTADMITERKFLSWNASTAGQMEIIEYLEELVELVKLLVGVNAFRSGMLERPNYRQYTAVQADMQDTSRQGPKEEEGEEEERSSAHRHSAPVNTLRARAAAGATMFRRRTWADEEAAAIDTESEDEDEGIPYSLQRVGTRLREDSTVVRRRATYTAGTGAA